jgi:hypothetical protein
MSKAERIERYKEARRNPKGPVKRLYTLPEAAFYMGRTVPQMRELQWKGKVCFIKDGKRIFFDVRDLDSYIDQAKRQFTY